MLKTVTYDIAIVGGGLAGLSLAIQAAKAGYSTALYEKEVYPFSKVCGEYISLESKDFLASLGVDIDALQLPVINKLNVTDVAGKAYPFSLPLGGFGISRYMLDHLLFKIALQHGVHVFTNTRVENVVFNNNKFTVTTNKHQNLATIAAGCFGKRSSMDVKLKRPFVKNRSGGLQNYIGIKYHIKYPHANDLIELHNFKDGYCGISRIEGDKCCLCYLTTASNLKASGNSIKKMEEEILGQNPHLEKIFSTADFLYDKPLAISKISFSKKSQVEDHILMLGDAAGLITPLCGNGMSMAMHASKLAFEQMDAYLKKDISRADMEAMYSENWKENFGKRLVVGRLVQRLFGNNTSTALFLKLIHKSKWLSNKLIQSTHGQPF